ncbi:MAG: DUF4364 family protein [Clostridia bacterium]|nr:DUF4364 family protein [Clostridia bacterium]
MVEFDAFAGDIVLGGLRNMLEIKILVCYMLSRVKEPMSRKQLCDCLQGAGLVNFFDLNEAIDDLLKQKMIQEEEYLGEKCLTATEAGKENAQTLETTLTTTLRERSLNAALRLLSRAKAERETKVDIVKTETGYNVTFAIDGFGENLLTLSLYAADILQAEKLRENFLNNPAEVYSKIIDLLTSGQ